MNQPNTPPNTGPASKIARVVVGIYAAVQAAAFLYVVFVLNDDKPINMPVADAILGLSVLAWILCVRSFFKR